MRKKLFTIPRAIILFLLIIVSIMGVWLGLRTLIVKAMATSISNLEQQGFEIGHGGLSVTGFPFTVDARTQNVTISAPTSNEISPYTNWSVKSEELDLYSSTLTPLSWSALHTGDIRVDMRGLEGERYMFDISPATIDAQAAVRLSGQLKSLMIKMARARFNSVVGSVPPILEMEGARMDVYVKDNQATLDIVAKNFVLSDHTLGPAALILGPTIERIEIDAEIENWQILEQGGTVEWMNSPARVQSENWRAQWGSADMIGSFDIGFSDGKPEGVIRIKVKNVSPLLEKMALAGYISPVMTNQIKTFVAGIDSDKDSRKLIELTIRNGIVKYGFITLYEF